MTEQEIAALGPAFATYLGGFRRCFLQKRTAARFDNYCRCLLSDLTRKIADPSPSKPEPPCGPSRSFPGAAVSEVICNRQRRHEQAIKSHKKRRRRCVI